MPDPPHVRALTAPPLTGELESGDAARLVPKLPAVDVGRARKNSPAEKEPASASAAKPVDGDDKPPRDLADVAVRNAPPWLVSAVVHMALLIILALLVIVPPLERGPLLLKLADSEELGDQLENELVTVSANATLEEKDEIITPDDMRIVSDPFAAPPKFDPAFDALESTSVVEAPTVGLALSGRMEGMRQVLLEKYGGSASTEEAVRAALAWLAKQQRKDGAWSLRGPYSSGADAENEPAATAMALLAFLGHGDTHQRGEYRENVRRGLEALVRMQNAAGEFHHEAHFNERLYTHGQCTIAMCEAYGLTKDSRYRDSAVKAIEFCVKAQSDLGGWRYRPRMDADTSVTGWIVMALQSARMAGLDVPPQTLKEVDKFLDSVTQDGSLYTYQPESRSTFQPTEAMTAEALLCRQYLGWDRYDPRLIKGADYLLEHLPKWSERDVYYWYYGTQVMHHMEGEYWQLWNSVTRDLLVKNQVRAGAEAGSWDPKGEHPDYWALRGQGGRLYVTCLSVYMLEVYYRHMPLYAKISLER